MNMELDGWLTKWEITTASECNSPDHSIFTTWKQEKLYGEWTVQGLSSFLTVVTSPLSRPCQGAHIVESPAFHSRTLGRFKSPTLALILEIWGNGPS